MEQAGYKLEHVIKRRKGITFLGPISLSCGSMGCTAVIGPNGAGKSSFLRLVYGLDKPSQGNVFRNNELQGQSFVFQYPIMLRRNIYENLAFPLFLQKLPKRKIESKVNEWLARINLDKVEKMPVQNLSGGEKQKLSLARALITDPDVLFLDEPTSNLDGASCMAIENLLHEALGEGKKLFLITHDIAQARRLSDEIIFLHQGKLVDQLTSDEFFSNPKDPIIQAFLRGEIVV